MAERLELTVGQHEAGDRLDVYLGRFAAVGSRSAAQRLIDEGSVLVDGAPCTRKQAVRAGEVVEVDLPEPVPTELRGEYIPLDIRFEDEHLIVLSKQPGLVCHPAEHHVGGTLVNALVHHCGIENLGTLQGEDRPGIVHRLDKDTSGLMMVAKSTEVQQALQEAIQIRAVDRRYLTLVHGTVGPDTGLIDAPIGRDERDRLKMAVSDHPAARQAVTTFTVLERFEDDGVNDGFSLLECKLYTGRTHQIRVHMAYIKHPCVGDSTYGSRRWSDDLGLDRQFLHSYRLTFVHPVTGEELSFFDPLPLDLKEALASIEPFSRGCTAAGREYRDALAAR